MNSPSYDIRIQSYLALESISYNGKAVKVFDEFADSYANFPRIMLLDVTQTLSVDSKCGFAGDWAQTIKITDSITAARSKNRIELITKDILQRLVPFKGPYIDLSPYFIVWNVLANEQSSQSYTDGVRQYIDKNIRIFKRLSTLPDCDIKKQHPTQKPIKLYKYCLKKYAEDDFKILDTHLGSGSIAIACHDYGFELTACELDKEYFDKAVQRIQNHVSQQKLF